MSLLTNFVYPVSTSHYFSEIVQFNPSGTQSLQLTRFNDTFKISASKYSHTLKGLEWTGSKTSP